MVYRLIEVVTVFVHFGFVLYVVLGGFVAWKWRRTIGFHLLAVVWGAGSIAVGYDVPADQSRELGPPNGRDRGVAVHRIHLALHHRRVLSGEYRRPCTGARGDSGCRILGRIRAARTPCEG